MLGLRLRGGAGGSLRPGLLLDPLAAPVLACLTLGLCLRSKQSPGLRCFGAFVGHRQRLDRAATNDSGVAAIGPAYRRRARR